MQSTHKKLNGIMFCCCCCCNFWYCCQFVLDTLTAKFANFLSCTHRRKSWLINWWSLAHESRESWMLYVHYAMRVSGDIYASDCLRRWWWCCFNETNRALVCKLTSAMCSTAFMCAGARKSIGENDVEWCDFLCVWFRKRVAQNVHIVILSLKKEIIRHL